MQQSGELDSSNEKEPRRTRGLGDATDGLLDTLYAYLSLVRATREMFQLPGPCPGARPGGKEEKEPRPVPWGAHRLPGRTSGGGTRPGEGPTR